MADDAAVVGGLRLMSKRPSCWILRAMAAMIAMPASTPMTVPAMAPPPMPDDDSPLVMLGGGSSGEGDGGGGDGAGKRATEVVGCAGVDVTATPRKTPLLAVVAIAFEIADAAATAAVRSAVRMVAVTVMPPDEAWRRRRDVMVRVMSSGEICTPTLATDARLAL